MTTSTRLKLPMLVPGQLSREMTHNESLARLDFLVAAAVMDVGRDEPPSAPQSGDCYIVGDDPAGDWTGHPRALTSFTESGWRFATAIAGMTVLDRSTGCVARFDGAQWLVGAVQATRVSIGGTQVLGPQQPAIANHGSDATVNVILTALRAHGLIAS